MHMVIQEHFSKHTIISIAHRVGASENYDRIVVLDAGRLIGYGSYSEVSGLLSAESELAASDEL